MSWQLIRAEELTESLAAEWWSGTGGGRGPHAGTHKSEFSVYEYIFFANLHLLRAWIWMCKPTRVEFPSNSGWIEATELTCSRSLWGLCALQNAGQQTHILPVRTDQHHPHCRIASVSHESLPVEGKNLFPKMLQKQVLFVFSSQIKLLLFEKKNTTDLVRLGLSNSFNEIKFSDRSVVSLLMQEEAMPLPWKALNPRGKGRAPAVKHRKSHLEKPLVNVNCFTVN